MAEGDSSEFPIAMTPLPEEVELTTRLIVAVAGSAEPLSQETIDTILGVAKAPTAETDPGD